MNIVTVVGARPQFVKAAAVSRVLRRSHKEILVHTGQHYDYDMSEVFFQELAIGRPDIFLNVGSGTHGAQTGAMLAAVEQVLLAETPDMMLVYGDTNSTLAGALAAAKLHIPISHIEAGLRSFNRRMPEEINRVMTDHLASLLLCPSRTAVENLHAEGVRDNVFVVGDVMHDVLHTSLAEARARSTLREALGQRPQGYLLATVHRAENTNDRGRLTNILGALRRSPLPVILPIHPRTRAILEEAGVDADVEGALRIVPPLGYLDMLMLQSEAAGIVTDSGGVQKEAYWLGVPCITIRDETEWVETIESGCNVLVGSDPERIRAEIEGLEARRRHMVPPDLLYGDSQAAERCVQRMVEYREEIG